MSFRFRALLEDRGHEALVRGLLDRSRAGALLRVEPYPQGHGAGEQHVRKHLPAFVKDLRTKRNQRSLWGIVVADGDVVGMNARRLLLMKEVESAGLLPLTESDRVVLLVPTRNVETWGWCLLGNAVDETTDFKANVGEANLRATFCERWLPEQPAEPPSLVAGRSEWARLK